MDQFVSAGRMERSPQTTARVLRTFVKQAASEQLAQYRNELPLLNRRVRRASPTRLHRFLANREESVVFVHAGLRDIKHAFDVDPYAFLLETLDEHFEAILAPGFTPSFRQSGVFHLDHSLPEYGTFSRLFLDDATDRTPDPLHSILIRGEYDFSGCTVRTTFGMDGCWAQLDTDDVLILNIGTPWIIATQHHYIEHRMSVPYNHEKTYEGVMIHPDGEHEFIRQSSYEYDLPVRRNAPKIQQYLTTEDVLEAPDFSGLNVQMISTQSLRKTLEAAMLEDPYFLIA